MIFGRKSSDSDASSETEGARARLIAEIQAEARETASFTGRPAFSERVMEAVAKVAREEFAPFETAAAAYVNAPYAIGHGQTISQPYIVALMTDLLDPRPEDTVLEVGTGSGYQAAVLSLLVRQVYSIEVVPELARDAAARLARLGHANVEVRQGDGARGWAEHAPYDSIMVTAAAPEVPPALVEQLRPGGRMVIPVGRPWLGQTLTIIEKDEAGQTHERSVLPVAFVPLTHGKD